MPPIVIGWVIKVYPTPVDQQGRGDRRLLALRALGFQFAMNHDSGGVIVALAGFRAHHGVIDIVQFYDEHDVDAIRIPGDEPDILFPRTTIWRTTGTANDVIDNLLDLADPEHEGAENVLLASHSGFRTVNSMLKRIRRDAPDWAERGTS